MIKVLGAKRILTLAILVAVNAALALVAYGYLAPEKISKERELRMLRGQVSGLNKDIDNILLEFEQLEDQKAEFEMLEKDGFFKDQGRRQAEKLFNLIQEKSGVSKAQVSVAAGEIEDNEVAQKANHKILSSPVELRVEAMDEIDILRYVFLVEKYFPGHISLEKMKLHRDAEVNGTVLRSIASGKNVPLIKAEIEMLWRTMIPVDQLTEEGVQ